MTEEQNLDDMIELAKSTGISVDLIHHCSRGLSDTARTALFANLETLPEYVKPSAGQSTRAISKPQHPQRETAMNTHLTFTGTNNTALSFTVNTAGKFISRQWDETSPDYITYPVERETAADQEQALLFGPAGFLELDRVKAQADIAALASTAAEAALSDFYTKRDATLGEYKPVMGRIRKVSNVILTAEGQTPGPEHILFIEDIKALTAGEIKFAYEAWETGCGVARLIGGPQKRQNGQDCPASGLSEAYAYIAARETYNDQNDYPGLSERADRLSLAALGLKDAVLYAPIKTPADIVTKISCFRDLWADDMESLALFHLDLALNLASEQRF